MAREGRHELPRFCIDVDFNDLPEGNQKASRTIHDSCIAAICHMFALSRVERAQLELPSPKLWCSFKAKLRRKLSIRKAGWGLRVIPVENLAMQVVPLLAHFRRPSACTL